LAALSEAAEDDALRAQGKRLAIFIRQVLWKDNSLLRAVDHQGESMGPGGLNDYAWAALGLLRWADVSNDTSSAKLGHQLVRAAWQRFHTEQGWRETEQTLLPEPLYQRHLPDGAIPSPEAILLKATQLSLRLKPEKQLRKQLDSVLATSTQSVEEGLYWYGSLIATALDHGAK